MFYSTESPSVGRDLSDDARSHPGSACRLQAGYCARCGERRSLCPPAHLG